MIAAKYGKNRKGNKEDGTLLKKDKEVSSEKFKKIYEVLEGLRSQSLGIQCVLGALKLLLNLTI
jgi:hypothetical protein